MAAQKRETPFQWKGCIQRQIFKNNKFLSEEKDWKTQGWLEGVGLASFFL